MLFEHMGDLLLQDERNRTDVLPEEMRVNVHAL